MRVLLIQPRVSAEPAYPLALAGIIPLLEGAGHTVIGRDLCFDDEAEVLALAGDVDWIGATVLHHNAPSVRRWMAPLTDSGRVRTFVAGALPTLDPMGALAQTGAEFAVVGPPEDTVADLIDSAAPEHVAGVVHRTRATPKPRFHTPMALLPSPDRRVFPVEQYTHAMRSTALPYAQVITSRGCTLSCPYCPVPSMRPDGFDPRDPAQVAAEWDTLVTAHGVRSIHVEDDNFLAERGHAEAICRALTDRGVSVAWELVNGIRPDQVDEVLLSRMAAAGCRRIVYSFEHLAAGQPPAIGTTLEHAERVVAWAKASGMRVGGYFMVGLPGESLSSNVLSIRYALGLGLDDANWVPFYESPGSGFADCISTIDATALDRRHAIRLAKAATIAFFANPRTFGRLGSEMAATPATLPSLALKAVELLRAGGPVPLRDTP